MLAYGKNPFYEALNVGKMKKGFIKNDDRVIELLKKHGIPYETYEPNKHKEKFGKDSQGYAFEFDVEFITFEELIDKKDENNLVCILDHIQDPQNFGAIIRAGHCFGVKTFVIAKDNQAPITAAVLKSSAGALVYSKFLHVTNISRTIEEMKKIGFWIYAADMNGNQTISDIEINKPSAVIIGSEGDGIRTNVLKKADVVFKIPMKAKIDSLNASQSASICFYEFSKKI
ncbi:MAG: 23S rRNA (guanosine(2251)-2'-O)-methyltransferase RlmB [Calditerrivibrio sp.]|nr:23S rRNA (guanosine(2251)-2'-O)-methyltransferase RlmB [Calditerrivibrio sp.]MCA1932697.1 23S rRNA (guanosine(2251)-2'-O)-methyltransferase RlmB [Calditerrivibrio sp.]MCA1980745.1 23S rRNA (guanosine(2251)-2'-O)-methyltransferase RlmB [Calditerrivibrio sp.]